MLLKNDDEYEEPLNYIYKVWCAMKIIRTIIEKIFFILNCIIPKRKRVYICGGDKLYDNNEAMFDYLLKYTDINVICTANHTMQYNIRDGVKIKKNNIFNNIYYSITSLVLLDSFARPIKIVPTKRQNFIQMWHGSPFKGAGDIDFSAWYSTWFCAAPAFLPIIENTLCRDKNKLFLSGNPRNDYLFHSDQGTYTSHMGQKRILWMPTFRKGLGKDNSSIDIPIINDFNASTINDCLISNNQILYIKPHPHQLNKFEFLRDRYENIVLVDDECLMHSNTKLYSFIGSMDALITDYSSVFYDYLLLNRPIGFAIDDLDEYTQKRGFSVNDPVDLMPGHIITNLDEFLQFLISINGIDKYEEKRKKIKELANYYEDGNRERCAKLIKKSLSERNNNNGKK